MVCGSFREGSGGNSNGVGVDEGVFKSLLQLLQRGVQQLTKRRRLHKDGERRLPRVCMGDFACEYMSGGSSTTS